MASHRMNILYGHLRRKAEPDLYISHAVNRTVTPERFSYTLDNPRLTPQQRQFYEDNGFIVVKNLVPSAALQRWRNRFLDLVDGRATCPGLTIMKDVSLKNQEGLSAERVVNKIQDFLWDEVLSEHSHWPEIVDYVECFTGPNIMAMHSMLINKPPDPGSRTSRHPLHQDIYYFPFRPANHIVCAWTAMEKVDVDNGCLFVVPGSHKGEMEIHEYPEWENGVNKLYHGVRGYDNHPKTNLEMNEGDTVFFHPILLHGSGYNRTEGFRKAISCHYAASECSYIDVQGTIQEKIAKEVEEVAKRKGLTNVDFRDIWKMRSRCIRGREVSL